MKETIAKWKRWWLCRFVHKDAYENWIAQGFAKDSDWKSDKNFKEFLR